MKSKYKATPFSRFLIFLIFSTPVAFVGASYYNGEDGIEKIKSVLQMNISKDEKISVKEEKIKLLREEITELQEEILELKNGD